jgi:hypothetical protein
MPAAGPTHTATLRVNTCMVDALSTLVLSESELDLFTDQHRGYLRIIAVLPDVDSDQYCVLSDVVESRALWFHLCR